ncbi:4'-phosphopantetheinyl transferase superfamily protein [Vibrio kyushuensis]|uniref:4'-phosphopantetheinyl transferase family protein n=1 Tax=Vibrio TaxID=662 RepID=UPI003D11C0F5
MFDRQPQVDLWLCPLIELDETFERISHLKTFLTPDEIAKVDRYRMHADRIRALYVRAYLRSILSRYCNIEPTQWRFEYGDKGKPTLEINQLASTGLHFNISHSKDHLLIGVFQSPADTVQLGIDIEHTRESTDIHAITAHYFSSREVEDLNSLPAVHQRARFFDLWALKESYIKATGKGLSTSLKSFSFDFSSMKVNHDHDLVGNDVGSTCSNGKFELYTGIDIVFADHTSDKEKEGTNSSTYWQSALGRLNDQYRFAVTLGGVSNDMIISMHEFGNDDLFR